MRPYSSSRSTLAQDSIGSDRLRKAIERNRRKQAKRAPTAPLPSPPPPPPPAPAKQLPPTPAPAPAPVRPPAPLTPEPVAPPRKKFWPHLQNYLVKSAWVFFGILTLRLILSDGGVLDYYARKEVLESKVQENQKIVKRNKVLLKEIEKIRTNSQYQKKLVRDHLGFIAADEYLILFVKEKS